MNQLNHFAIVAEDGTQVGVRQVTESGDSATITVTTPSGEKVMLAVQPTSVGFVVCHLERGTRDHLDEVVRQGNMRQFGDDRPMRRH